MEAIIGRKTMTSPYQKKHFNVERYIMTTYYADNYHKTEGTNNFISLLNTAAIYLMDPACVGITVEDQMRNERVLTYWRD